MTAENLKQYSFFSLTFALTIKSAFYMKLFTGQTDIFANRHNGAVAAEDIQKMAQVIADNAQAGDVVMCMGAGSIGQVPAKVLELVQQRKS